MSEPTMMLTEAHVIGFAKLMALTTISLFGAVYTGVSAAIGGEGNTVAIGTTLGVSVTFAGIILRQVIKNQSAIWDIVRSKDEENKSLKRDLEYVTWEREQARFRAKERTDPGPFQLSPQLAMHIQEGDTKITTNYGLFSSKTSD